MSELSSVLPFGAGIVAMATVPKWPAICRRLRRLKRSVARRPAPQDRPTVAPPFGLLNLRYTSAQPLATSRWLAHG
jgi:hypothetical protein